MATAPNDGSSDTLDYSPLRALTNLGSIAWQHKSLVLLGATVSLVLAGFAYVQTSPVYQSAAQVLVIKKRPDVVIANPNELHNPNYYEDYLATHVVLLQSDEVLRRAARRVDAGALSAPPPAGGVVQLLKAGLAVTRDKDANSSATNILNISVRSTAPTDSVLLLNAVIDGYKDFLTETYGSMSDETVQLITKAQNLFDKELKQKQKEHMAICQRDPLSLKIKEGGLFTFQERIRQIESRRSAIEMRQKEIETRQKLIANALKDGKGRPAILAMIRESASGAGKPNPATELENALVQLQLQLEEQSQILGPKHPQVQAVQKRIDTIREQLARNGKADQAATDLDPLDLLVQSLALEHAENRILLDALEPSLKEEQEHAQTVARFLVEEEETRVEVNRLRQAFDNISDRLRQINLTREAGGFDARTITPAAAGVKVAPQLLTYAALALIGGLAAGLGLAYLADFADKSFRSPQEIQQRLGLAVVGHIPHIAPAPADPAALECAAAALAAYHEPRSPAAEAFRGVRTALYFSTQGGGHQVVQLTSPGMGDGKSTLAANLAVSIAQSGKRTVLIDADFRRPRLHKFFPSVNRAVGLSSVIAGQARPEEAIQPTAVANLSLLPCGPRPSNPAELLTSPRFQEFLAAIRPQFDFVLLDTPPVLLVSDPCAVAPRVDGVLLVLRLGKNNRPTAERACEVLASLGAKVLGVMVNDKSARSGAGYGYSAGYGYRYDYRYSYQYGYGYQPAYGETDDESRPARPPAEPPAANGYHGGEAVND